jgi:hypothetical protein
LDGLVYESSNRASMCQSAPHKLHIVHNRCFRTRLSDDATRHNELEISVNQNDIKERVS